MKKKVVGEKAVETKAVPTAMLKQGKLENIDIERLYPSKTNPRKSFGPAEMEDLANSIKDKGIIQPLLARKHATDVYEIICGARRYGAAKMVGLKTLPCLICEMTDAQVVEVQVVENMQRADLTPLEEAKGYEQLHEQYKYDWPELAARIGKSQGYIFTRLNLLKLIPGFQKQLAEGELKLSYAEEITKIQDPKDQEALLKDMSDNEWDYEELDSLQEEIRDKFLLQLRVAPFPVKDEDLQGGACGSCAKRTGAQSDLFGDLQGKNDTCRDAKCWAAKKAQYEKNGKEKYKDYAKAGHRVLIGAEAETAIASGRYAKMTDEPYQIGGNHKTWAKALEKKPDYKPLIAVDAKGTVHKLVNPSAAARLFHSGSRGASAAESETKQKENYEKAKVKEEVGELAAAVVLEKLAKAAVKMDLLNNKDFLLLMLDAIDSSWDDVAGNALDTKNRPATIADIKIVFLAKACGSNLIEGAYQFNDNKNAGKPERAFLALLKFFKLEKEFDVEVNRLLADKREADKEAAAAEGANEKAKAKAKK